MIDIIEQAFDTLHERVIEMPNKVLNIFNNFFGEERVDMQGFSKEDLVDSVLDLSLGSIFNMANMDNKLPLTGFDRSEILGDIDFSLVPTESIATVAEAILSTPFIEKCKEIDGFILVHFPRTVVTNEYDRSTIVNHIFIKVPITATGAEGGIFTMNRSEYTVAEMVCNYMHSHASSIPIYNFHDFTHCCLGSGPLKNTQTYLSHRFDEDRWNIFCLELSKYVEVESIAGTPYHRLENIGINYNKIVDLDRLYNKNLNIRRSDLKQVLYDFFIYYLDNNNLTFSFRNGVYSIGMSFTDYLINISNSFIEWVNKQPSLRHLESVFNNIVKDYLVINGDIHKSNGGIDVQDYREYIGKEICTFKGKSITISITDIDRVERDYNTNSTKLLHIPIASKLLNRILTTLNYRYGRNQENPDSTSGKVRYKI